MSEILLYGIRQESLGMVHQSLVCFAPHVNTLQTVRNKIRSVLVSQDVVTMYSYGEIYYCRKDESVSSYAYFYLFPYFVEVKIFIIRKVTLVSENYEWNIFSNSNRNENEREERCWGTAFHNSTVQHGTLNIHFGLSLCEFSTKPQQITHLGLALAIGEKT